MGKKKSSSELTSYVTKNIVGSKSRQKWQPIIFRNAKKWNLDGPDSWSLYWHDLRKESEWFFRRRQGGRHQRWFGQLYAVINKCLKPLPVVVKQYYTKTLEENLL